jgi:hypothetical protein
VQSDEKEVQQKLKTTSAAEESRISQDIDPARLKELLKLADAQSDSGTEDSPQIDQQEESRESRPRRWHWLQVPLHLVGALRQIREYLRSESKRTGCQTAPELSFCMICLTERVVTE